MIILRILLQMLNIFGQIFYYLNKFLEHLGNSIERFKYIVGMGPNILQKQIVYS